MIDHVSPSDGPQKDKTAVYDLQVLEPLRSQLIIEQILRQYDSHIVIY